MTDQPETVRLVINIPDRLRQELDLSAKAHDRSLAAEVRTALRLYCGIRNAGTMLQPSVPQPEGE